MTRWLGALIPLALWLLKRTPLGAGAGSGAPGMLLGGSGWAEALESARTHPPRARHASTACRPNAL